MLLGVDMCWVSQSLDNQWRIRSRKSCLGLKLSCNTKILIKKSSRNPLLRAHLGTGVSKISALPRHWDHPIQGSVFNWMGRGSRGAPGDKTRGGWGRIYDLSIFPFFDEKQDCCFSACGDEWSSYKLTGMKGGFVAWYWHCCGTFLFDNTYCQLVRQR